VDNAVERHYRKGQTISPEDAPPIGLFAVLQGEVALVRHVGEDRQILYHVGGPGFWFGELGVIRGETTAVTVLAREDTTVLLLAAGRFRELTDQHPEFLAACMRLVCQRFAILIRYLAQAQWLSPEEYLRVRLADLAELRRQDGTGAGTEELDISQADLAQMVGTSRQTVNALLQRIEAEGLIEVKFRKIRILDIERLRGQRRKSGL
jgi:CRP-like cAMP-binding protein